MPIIDYYGQRLNIDTAYSYARFSTSLQSNDGDGIWRQIEMAGEFSRQYGVPLDPLSDLGKSGSKGAHLENGGALGEFMKLATTKQLKPNAALLVESFSRLSRLPIDLAMDLFLRIISSGVTLVTLIDHRAYTVKTLRADHGQIYGVASHMQAARAEAESRAYYITKSWEKRRGSATNNIPAWIVRTDDGLARDESKSDIVKRICDSALTMGVDRIARDLNADGVSILHNRKRRSGKKYIWEGPSILAILRGKQILGLQEIGKSGEFIPAYPAVIDEAQWHAIQARLDSRKSGTFTGRNVSLMRNVFGSLVRCECGSRMKVQGRGKLVPYVYLKCVATISGACSIKRLYRLDWMEKILLPKIVEDDVMDTPRDDPSQAITARIANAKAKLQEIESAYLQSMSRSGDLAIKTQTKLEANHKAKLSEIAKLERELAGAVLTKPASELQMQMRRVVTAALAGDVAARGQIANSLPGLVHAIICRADGWIRVQFGGIPGFGVSWTVKLRNPVC